MQDLAILNKFPRPGHTKTRLGKVFGYQESALLAQFLLEDLVETASRVCAVTIVCPYADVEDFRNAYPDWEIYGTPQGVIPALHHTVKDFYHHQGKEKVMIITGDVIVSEREMQSGFHSLDTHNLVIGATYDGGFYQVGLDEQFGHCFAGLLSERDDAIHFLRSCILGLGYFPKVAFSGMKTDIDVASELLPSVNPIPPGRTRNYVDFLLHQCYLIPQESSPLHNKS